MNNKLRRIFCVCLALTMTLLLAACSGGKAENISLYDLNRAMSEAASFGDMNYVSSQDDNAEELFSHISDMDYSDVAGFFINYAVNGTGNADEIACIQVKNQKNISAALSSLEAHLKTRTGLYSSYDKSQLDKLSKAKTAVKGDVAVLIIGDNSEKIEKAFYDYFG